MKYLAKIMTNQVEDIRKKLYSEDEKFFWIQIYGFIYIMDNIHMTINISEGFIRMLLKKCALINVKFTWMPLCSPNLLGYFHI